MSNKILGLALLLLIMTGSFWMTELEFQLSKDRKDLLVLAIVAEAGATKWDEEATAEAGMIVIDELEATEKILDLFQVNYPNANLNLLEIEVINDAPTARFKNGLEHFFIGNGVMVSYDGFTQIAEADDRLKKDDGGIDND